MIFDPSKETRPEVLAAEEEYFGCKPCFEKGRNRHIFQSGFNAGAASRDAEIAELKDALGYDWDKYKASQMALRECMQMVVEQDSEIAELVALLTRYRNETPLGHQPHMIAHLVDEALAKVRKQT